METADQITSRIANLKARRKTDAVQRRIEHLERLRNQILSADKKEDRKNRTRALIILGSAVISAAEDPGEQFADWLCERVRQLPAKDQAVIRAAFPKIFSSGANAPATADGFLPPQAAAPLSKETHDE